ncbi:zebrafish testis-expressed 38 [Rhinichthys klamathensis goyatoka]|uniref:zebrafish testis-expressed 38 n=1 Tax=Rhinichthys klamathensis goyatoka TaxID=3034132 RepID=UPI0024B63354|nr:zebrafish testis-expressed 38 [Rhinichthys klamathensis goyatoka]
MTTRQKTLTRDKQVIAEALDTETQSLVFVKRMVVLAVSSITYLRGIFPEDSYRSRYLEDLCIKVLKKDCTCPAARNLVKWLMGCFDALEKRYLQMVVIGVHTSPDDINHVIESYQFKFRYSECGPQMDIMSNVTGTMRVTLEDTKKASTLLIKKLFLLMQHLEALPTDVYLTMKLYYYDDVTPPEYEPPGFKAGVNDSLWFEGKPVHFRVGDLQSRFHTMKLRVTAAHNRLGKLQDGGQLSDNDTEMVTPSLSQIRAVETMTRNSDQDLPSEDESLANFKQPRKAIAKRKCVRSKLPRRKKKKCF